MISWNMRNIIIISFEKNKCRKVHFVQLVSGWWTQIKQRILAVIPHSLNSNVSGVNNRTFGNSFVFIYKN